MDEVTQQNSALVEENAATAKTLEHQARAMDERVAFFRIDGAAAVAQPHAQSKVQPIATAAAPLVTATTAPSARRSGRRLRVGRRLPMEAAVPSAVRTRRDQARAPGHLAASRELGDEAAVCACLFGTPRKLPGAGRTTTVVRPHASSQASLKRLDTARRSKGTRRLLAQSGLRTCRQCLLWAASRHRLDPAISVTQPDLTVVRPIV